MEKSVHCFIMWLNSGWQISSCIIRQLQFV